MLSRPTVQALGIALCAAACWLAGCSKATPPVRFISEGKPAQLSEWHVLLAEDGRLKLNEGVLPYELNTPLFTDHAHKLRTVWMPAGSAARYSERDSFDFPVGTVITKTFYYPRAKAGIEGGNDAALPVRQTSAAVQGGYASLMSEGLQLADVHLVETRVLVRRAEGWLALPYVWNAQQTDAQLERTGDLARLDLVDEQDHHQPFTYVVPNENQCAACHAVDLKAKVLQPIGPKARHLNRDLDYAEGIENQLARWVRSGYLSGAPDGALPRAADWRDERAPLADRARAYLDINCAHCHHTGGPASNTALALDTFSPADRAMGLCKPAVAAGKGTGDRLFGIVPGQPDASIMTFRMSSTEGGVMMPELGRSTAHEEGVRLIRQWIGSMPGHCDKL